MHVGEDCPTLPRASISPPVIVTTAKAQRALDNVRKHLDRTGKAPFGQLKKALADYMPEAAWVCRNDPDACLDVLLSQAEAAPLASDPCAPRYGTLTGDVMQVRSLPEQPGGVGYTALVLHGLDEDVRLVVPSGQRVKKGKRTLSGVALGKGTFVVSDGGTTTVAANATAPGLDAVTWPTTGRIREVTQVATYDNAPTTVTDQAILDNAAWNRRYYASTSYGLVDLQATQLPRVTLPGPAPCDAFSSFRSLQASIEATTDICQVEQVQMFGKYPCGWGGNAAVGPTCWRSLKDPTKTCCFGIAQNQDDVGWMGVAAHERGHALGLLHGNMMQLPSRFPLGGRYAATKFVEYGRNLTLLGNSSSNGPFGVLARFYLGWLPVGPTGVLVTPAVGTYTLAPISQQAAALRGLVWQESGAVYAGLEYRADVNEFEHQNVAGKRMNCLHLTSSSDNGAPEEDEHDVVAGEPCLAVGETVTTPSGWRFQVTAPDTVAIQAQGTPLPSPTFTITTPINGSIVSGQVALDGTVSGGIWRVQWSYNGGGAWRALPPKLAAPWGTTFDSTLVADGRVSLLGAACNGAGMCAYGLVTVLTQNGIATTTTAPPTTTTTLPNVTYAVIEHLPNPSVVGEPVVFTVRAKKNDQFVPVSSLHINLSDAANASCVAATRVDANTLQCTKAYSAGCLPCFSSGFAFDGTAWTDIVNIPHNVVTATVTTTSGVPTTTGAPTTTVAPTTSTSTTRPPTTTTATTSSSSTTTVQPSTSSTSTRPTTSTTRVPTTTTLRPTTTTTTVVPCRARGTSCVLNGQKHPELCCSRRCGGARKCR
jgi:hypothetical protein